MRLGKIFTACTLSGFNAMKAQGLEFAEVCCNSEVDAYEFIGRKEAVKAAMAETGMAISSVGRWCHDVQVDGKLDPQRLKSYIALLDTAIELGAKTFVCGINYDESVSLFRNYANAVEFFKILTDRAGSAIKVAIENCDWNNFVHSPQQWEVLLGENPNLYIKFDPSHAYNRGDDYLAQISDWGHKFAHMHVKGTVHAGSRGVDDPPAGMDDIKWSSVFAVLYARKYDGDLSIEPHSETWSGALGDRGVEYTIKFIRQFML